MNRKIFNSKHLFNFRRQLRNDSTAAERYLWKALKGRKLEGRKFRRQHSIGNYIVDFYCPSEKLIIELDGIYHFNPVYEDYDHDRKAYFLSLNLTILTFENRELFENLDMVLEAIRIQFCKPPRPSGTPPSKGGEFI